MDNGIYKAAIASVTGLLVGERDGVWVVKDATGWRTLLAAEQTAITAEYDRMYKDFIVPKSITMRQARLVLNSAGLLTTVQQSIGAMPTEVQIEWEYANVVVRNSPIISTLQTALGLTDAQVDQMFIDGAAL